MLWWTTETDPYPDTALRSSDTWEHGAITRPSSTTERSAPNGRGTLAVAVCVAAIAAYNWWVAVPYEHRLASVDSFFSDLEVRGAPGAALYAHLDIVAGTLFLLALCLVLPATRARRTEWWLFTGFAVAATAGGLFPFSCAEGADSVCRRAEWHFQLPLSHYLHMLFGIFEFAAITAAVIVARRRTSRLGAATAEATAFRWLAVIVVVGYGPLAIAYIGDRLGAFVEPVFFVAFSAAMLTEIVAAAGELPRLRSNT
jgi:hypothetical protein